MADAPLIITPAVEAALTDLRRLAAASPVDVQTLMATLEDPKGRAAHFKQMHRQTVLIAGPFSFFVTFSIETGQPCGTCRHMSMSIKRDGRVPSPAAVWMVAELLGFTGSIAECAVWPEELTDGGTAINVVQPTTIYPAGHG